jgi:5'-nucleotidase
VNVPPGPPEAIKGYLLTRQGKRRYSDVIVEKVDPRGKKYYWIGGGELDYVAAEGTDFAAVHSGYISITPLHLDLTNYASLQRLAKLHVPWP